MSETAHGLPTSTTATPTAATQPATRPSAEQLGKLLLWTTILLIVFLAASLAIRRFSLAFRRYVLRAPTRPTAADDVWKMHRLPDDWDEHRKPTNGDPPP